jgi:hypothetical protein
LKQFAATFRCDQFADDRVGAALGVSSVMAMSRRAWRAIRWPPQDLDVVEGATIAGELYGCVMVGPSRFRSADCRRPV